MSNDDCDGYRDDDPDRDSDRSVPPISLPLLSVVLQLTLVDLDGCDPEGPHTTTTTTTTTTGGGSTGDGTVPNNNIPITTTTTTNTTTTIPEWFTYIESCYDCRNHHHPNILMAQTAPPVSSSSSSSSSSFFSSSSSECVWDTTKFQILQYIQHKDRFIQLSSVLLKSYAYYYHCHSRLLSSSSSSSSSSQSHLQRLRPILILPRTMYHQPYIPERNVTPTETLHTSLFSISHQYPVVGLVQPPPHPFQQQSSVSCAAAMVGLDIVLFDAHYSSKLYQNRMEYLQVYEEYFTQYEWNDCIMMTNNRRHSNDKDDMEVLQEFYIQWSIKEAYTKALGVGMNMDFASFETNIHRSTVCVMTTTTTEEKTEDDDDHRPTNHTNNSPPIPYCYWTTTNDDTNHTGTNNGRVWEWIRQRYDTATNVESSSTQSTHKPVSERRRRPHFVICTIGTVTQVSSTSSSSSSNNHSHQNNNPDTPTNVPPLRPHEEQYYFYFLPLFATTTTTNNNDKNDETPSTTTTTTSTTNTATCRHDEMIGCATICYGPISAINTDPTTTTTTDTSIPHPFPTMQIQSMTLQQLIAFHTGTETAH